jgi:hypothetical protein
MKVRGGGGDDQTLFPPAESVNESERVRPSASGMAETFGRPLTGAFDLRISTVSKRVCSRFESILGDGVFCRKFGRRKLLEKKKRYVQEVNSKSCCDVSRL